MKADKTLSYIPPANYVINNMANVVALEIAYQVNVLNEDLVTIELQPTLFKNYLTALSIIAKGDLTKDYVQNYIEKTTACKVAFDNGLAMIKKSDKTTARILMFMQPLLN